MLCTGTLQISVEVVYMLKHWAWIETLCCDSNTQQFSFSQFRKKIAVPPSPSNSLSPRNIPMSLEKITSVLIMAAFLCPFSAKPWSKVSWNNLDYFYWLLGLLFSPEHAAKLVFIFHMCGAAGAMALGRSVPQRLQLTPHGLGDQGMQSPPWAALLPLKWSLTPCFDF